MNWWRFAARWENDHTTFVRCAFNRHLIHPSIYVRVYRIASTEWNRIQFSGVPLSAAKRIQFNFELEPIEEIPLMRNVPKMIFPFLWVEEGAIVPSLYVKLLKYTLILYASIADKQATHFLFMPNIETKNENQIKFLKKTSIWYVCCRLQRANWSILIGSLIGAPIAAICSYTLHLLIKYKKIQVISKTIGSAFKKVQEKITDAVDIVVQGTENVSHS